MAEQLREIYQLKVELKGIRPPVWRRFWVSNAMALDDFHHALQIVMGWTNSHLHMFTAEGVNYGLTDPELGMDWNEDMKDESQYKVKDILKAEGGTILYEYDFGDGWEHKVTLEKVLPFTINQHLPLCIKGKRACPPEDVGGTWGYKEFLEAWLDKKHPEHKAYKAWARNFYGPEFFDLDETNEVLADFFEL